MVISKERLQWLDAIKLFAIILVVWGHLIPRVGFMTPEPTYDSFYGVNALIYSFHMPLFMTMSGFVSSKIKHLESDFFWGGIFRKFKQLIVPCITVAFIGPFIHFYDSLWYLKSLFVCYLICAIYFRINFKYKFPVCLFAFILIAPLLTRIPFLFRLKIDFMLPFFVLGLFLYEKKHIIKENLKYFLLGSGVLFLFCIFFWDGQYVWYNSRSNWIDYYVLLKDYRIHHYLLNNSNVVHVLHFLSFDNLLASIFRLFTGCVASIFFMCLFMRIFEAIKFDRLSILGQYSLHVYILHKLFVNSRYLRDIFLSYGITPTNNRFLYLIITLLVAIVISYCCILIGKLLEKNRYAGFLLFGKS